MKFNPEDFSDKPLDVPLSVALAFEKRGHTVYTNVPHLVIHHSPDGFSFGYSGSGPADMALNYCEWYLQHIGYQGMRINAYQGGCFLLASRLHQSFKQAFLTLDVPRSIPYVNLNDWFNQNITPDLVKMCEIWEDEA